MKRIIGIALAAGASTLYAASGQATARPDWESVASAFAAGNREAIRVPLEALLGSTAVPPADRAECLRYLSALYGDEAADNRRAASYMLQLVRLEPQRKSLGLPVKPATDSQYRAVFREYHSLKGNPAELLRTEPEIAAGSGKRVLPWIAGIVACLGLGAAVAVLAWP